MDYEKREQVVFVKDLLFAALYRWRSMLAAALIGALLFGGVAAFLSYQTARNLPSPEEQQEELATYEEKKEALETQLEKDTALVTNQEKYIKDSLVMKMDPYCVYRAIIDLNVQTDYQILPGMTYQNPDDAGAILNAYQAYMSGDQVIEAVADDIGLESKYLWEMISLSNGGSATRNLRITINYNSVEGAEQILDAFLGHLDQAQKKISQTVGEHTVQVVSTRVDQRIDLSITDQQNAAETRLENLRKQQASTEKALEKLQEPVFHNGLTGKEIVVLVVLGGILGAGLIACVAWFKHLAGNLVYSPRTLINKTGLKILGCVPHEETANPIDKWLKKTEGRTVDKDLTDVTMATIRNYSAPGQRLLLFGDCDLSLQEQLAQELKNSGIPAAAYGSLLRSAQAQNALSEGDLVLLVEQCGVSRYSNIILSIELLEDLNKDLIGCVLLGG